MLAETGCRLRHRRRSAELERAAEGAEAVLLLDHHPAREHVRLLQRLANAEQRSHGYPCFAQSSQGVVARQAVERVLDLGSQLDAMTRAVGVGREPRIVWPVAPAEDLREPFEERV